MSRALLFTDVVDSTQLAEQLGDVGTAALWARHDRVARDLLPVHGGREIDKTDGFLLLFDDACAAVAYAVAYHGALRGLGLAARAGLHVGDVILSENAPADVARGAKPLEVDGLAKPIAARVMSVALGGQTLLTREAADALGRTALRLQSHGHWRLKGVAEPVELFEVGDGQAPMTPPPDVAKAWRVVLRDGVWLPVREVPHRLPAERDPFVGRDADLRTLADMLETVRLVSVLGIGGTGKTRLVSRFAWTWLGDYPGGAWFCDLSEARDVDGICAAVAKALDVPLGQADPVVQLGHAIAGRGACLVVLDNFEQVARHAPATLGEWLDRARDAHFVVTTREVLGLPGESALALAPLRGDEAVGLFVARAKQAKVDFVVDDPASIGTLVALLDHLPLAIELAAARVRVMAPKTLLERMSQRFKLLSSTGGRHTRQATLRATFDWSWDLLAEDERAALAQLSVFEGGFTLEAAEAVLSLSELWPTDAVQALVDRSWVRRVAEDRFDLLVSVQEYAAERLEASGGRAAAEARHGDHFGTFGTSEAIDALFLHGGVARRRAVAADLDNLIAATRRATARGAGDLAVRTLLAASQVLRLRTPVVVELELARAVCALPRLSSAARAQVLRVYANALQALGQGAESMARLDEAMASVRGAEGDWGATDERAYRRFVGVMHNHMGLLLRAHGRRNEARAHLETALAVAREVGSRLDEGHVLNNLGGWFQEEGRMHEARASYEAGLAVSREVGNRRSEANALMSLGLVDHQQGRSTEALLAMTQAMAPLREAGDRRMECLMFSNLANVNEAMGQREEVHRHRERALVLARELGDRALEATVLIGLGGRYEAEGHLELARACLAQAVAIEREARNARSEGIALGNLGNVHRAQGRREDARAAFVGALALHRQVEFRYGQGYWLAGLAGLAFEDGSEPWRALIDEAVVVSAPFPTVHASMLSQRARLGLRAGDVAGARADVDAAKALNVAGDLGVMVAFVDARTCHAEGRTEAGREALREAQAHLEPGHLGSASSGVAELDELRALLGEDP